MKRYLPASLLLAIGAFVLPTLAHAGDRDEFQLVETTIADIQHEFQSGDLTPEELVRMYLARIAKLDQGAGQPLNNGVGPQPLNSFMHVNEHAVDAARALKIDDFDDDDSGDGDAPRMPLFGIPVILKDNIATKDMPTTAGSVALGASRPTKDAFLTAKLRAAGAIILGKGTLTEFANFISVRAMPTGYNSQLRFQLFQGGGDLARVGYGFNPFDPRLEPRAGINDGRPALQTGGSSSGPGIAVSANLATVGVGTETSGSILSPATQNLLVGIKPTVGLVSRTGIVPITADQDTAGPLARTVTDAAKLLGVLAGFDPKDPATAPCLTPGNCRRDYTKFLNRHALRGARIAVPHFGYWTALCTTNNGCPLNDGQHHVVLSVEQQDVMNNAIAVLRAEGATVTDPFDIPTQAAINGIGTCVTFPPPASCSTVLLFGFKRDLNSYLADFGPGASVSGCTSVAPPPVRTLTDVVNFNNSCKVGDVAVGIKYDQNIAINADKLDTRPGSSDTARYRSDRQRDLDTAKAGLDAVFKNFDAVLFPANRGAATGARAGYPSIAVPGGFVVNPAVAPPPFLPPTPFPAGFNAKPAPYAVTFTGPAFSEPKLIGYAYAFEQATQHRVSPPLRTDADEK